MTGLHLIRYLIDQEMEKNVYHICASRYISLFITFTDMDINKYTITVMKKLKQDIFSVHYLHWLKTVDLYRLIWIIQILYHVCIF